MKTTVEIPDKILERAKRFAKRKGRPLRAVIEDGIRLAIATEDEHAAYRLPDRSVGNPKGKNPLESLSWPEIREEIYRRS